MANGDSTMNVTGGAAGAGEEPQGAEQQSLQYLLDAVEDREGSSLGGAEASRLISASAKSQKLVERAVAAIAVLENPAQFWNWRTVTENEVSKFCMSSEDSTLLCLFYKRLLGQKTIAKCILYKLYCLNYHS